jgi:hypothetical protein
MLLSTIYRVTYVRVIRGAGTTGAGGGATAPACCPNSAGAERGQQVAVSTGNALRRWCVIYRIGIYNYF